jgi:SMC interacting uncharacterized protein involved in chromosome segregation
LAGEKLRRVADESEAIRSRVREQAEEAESLQRDLKTISSQWDELRNHVSSARGELAELFASAEDRLRDANSQQRNEIDALAVEIRANVDAASADGRTVRSETARLLDEHLKSVDDRMIEFLSRQNVLVDNFQQQIDSKRVAIEDLATRVRDVEAKSFATIRKIISKVNEIERRVTEQGKALDNPGFIRSMFGWKR